MTTTTTQETQDITGHVFTLCAAFSLGIGVTEFISHLRDEKLLLQEWRWANISYFGARWCGLLTMASYIALASIGHNSSRFQCHGVFVFAHVFCALNSMFSASIFWTRCGALCNWNRLIIIPLGIYGIAISAFSLASSADDFAFKPHQINSSVCIVSMKSTNQSISRFLFASFDLMVAAVTFYALWYKSAAESWISRMLLKDQLVYIAVTMTAYLGLASSFLLKSPTAAGFGLLCPSVISVVSCRLFLRLKRKGRNNCRNKSFHNPDDIQGIKGLFRSRATSPNSSQNERKRNEHQEKEDYAIASRIRVTAEQSSSSTQLIVKGVEDERSRSASLSDSLLSQCRTRLDEGKKGGTPSVSMYQCSNSEPPPTTSSSADIEMCQEVLLGDQEGFSRGYTSYKASQSSF